eukprot:UN18965
MSFSKKTAPGAVFCRGFSNLKNLVFFLNENFQNFISFVFNEFLSVDYLIFFQCELRRHTSQW